MAALLQAALPGLTRRSLAAYAAGLLRALTPHPASPGTILPMPNQYPSPGTRHPFPLFEPLSPQEQRVLRLLVAGLSNAAIARELVVSANTIKTQLKSIYRKLDVANRDEAREAARELDLL
jgi:LuxR family maltose regulon positive regulatory protein